MRGRSAVATPCRDRPRVQRAVLLHPQAVGQVDGGADVVGDHPDSLAETGEGTTAHGLLLVCSGLLAAMAGDLDQGRRHARREREDLVALDRPVTEAAITTWSSAIELLAGDAAAAERQLRPAFALLQEAGARATLSSLSAQLAEALDLSPMLNQNPAAIPRPSNLWGTDVPGRLEACPTGDL